MAYDVLGTSYGGWPLLADTPRNPLIYSVGVGEDISFDLAAIAKYDAIVHAFDPTPRSQRWIEQQTLSPNFHFHGVGLAAVDGTARFYAPERSEHVSYSSQPAKGSLPDEMVDAPVLTLTSLIARVATPVPDVLKMDIEGFEYDVIESILLSDVRPAQLLVEFHHRMYGIPTEKTQNTVSALEHAGYRLFYVSEGGHEYGFFFDR